ncbi:MAG: sensor histidine kinase, partial [Anaerolineales bacterium]
LFRIAQESLSNTARHSKAKNTDLRLWEEDGRVYLEIIDNGEGFNIDNTKANLGHGLANMQRRTRKAAGGLKIDSSPGKGTKVTAWVPKE